MRCAIGPLHPDGGCDCRLTRTSLPWQQPGSGAVPAMRSCCSHSHACSECRGAWGSEHDMDVREALVSFPMFRCHAG